MSGTTGPCTSFTVFSSLPYELRCMIWETTCRPRVVELEYDDEDGFTPRCSDPIALKVCKESRNTIVQSYPLCFGSIFHPAKTRFNFSIDTLYIGNELEEDIPHFFGTFGPLEISSLQVLALDECYNATRIPVEMTLTRQLQQVVTKLTALREVLVVYDVAEMTDRSLSCSDGHAMELHEELPKELKHPSVMIDPLPSDDDELRDFKLWNVKKCKPVYGWRRCPHGVEYTDLDLDMDSDLSDEERYNAYGPWGDSPPSAMAFARMFGGPIDSDDEDMYGYDFEDEGDEEEDDDDDDISVESVD